MTATYIVRTMLGLLLCTLALAAPYESLKARRHRNRASPPRPPLPLTGFDPAVDKLSFDAGFECNSSTSAQQYAAAAVAELADFNEKIQFHEEEFDSEAQQGLERDLVAIAQQYYCAVLASPDNIVFLEGLANVMARSRHRSNGTIAMKLLIRCLNLGTFRDSEIKRRQCGLAERLHGTSASRECHQTIRDMTCETADECRSQASAFKSMGDNDLRLWALERAFQFDPDNSETNIWLSQLYLDMPGEDELHHGRYRRHRQQFVRSVDLQQSAATQRKSTAQNNKSTFVINDPIDPINPVDGADVKIPSKTRIVDDSIQAMLLRMPQQWLQNLSEVTSDTIFAAQQRVAAITKYSKELDELIQDSGLCASLLNASTSRDDAANGPHYFAKLILHLMIGLSRRGTTKPTKFPMELHEKYLGPPQHDTPFYVLWGETENDMDMSKYDYHYPAITLAQSKCPHFVHLNDATMKQFSGSKQDGHFLRAVWLMDLPLARELMFTPGTNILAVDNFGMNALQYAIINGDAPMLQLLLAFATNGPVFDVHSADKWGNSAQSMVDALPYDIPLYRHLAMMLEAYKHVGAACFVGSCADPLQEFYLSMSNFDQLHVIEGRAERNVEGENQDTAGAVISTSAAQGWATMTPKGGWNSSPSHVAVVDARNTSLKTVVAKYVAMGKPVIIRNALLTCAALSDFSRARLVESDLSHLRFKVVDGHNRKLRSLGDFIQQNMPELDDVANSTKWEQQICSDNTYIAQHMEAGWKNSLKNQIGSSPPARMEPISSFLDCVPERLQEYFQLAVRKRVLMCLVLL